MSKSCQGKFQPLQDFGSLIKSIMTIQRNHTHDLTPSDVSNGYVKQSLYFNCLKIPCDLLDRLNQTAHRHPKYLGYLWAKDSYSMMVLNYLFTIYITPSVIKVPPICLFLCTYNVSNCLLI